MDTYDYVCPHSVGCGDEMSPFRSEGWLTAEERDKRGAQHEAEHKTSTAMPSLAEFWEDQEIK